MRAKQIITYITKNNELAVNEIITTREETLNIFKELLDEIRILENRHAQTDRDECLVNMATSST